jgi:hypothetical protein
MPVAPADTAAPKAEPAGDAESTTTKLHTGVLLTLLSTRRQVATSRPLGHHRGAGRLLDNLEVTGGVDPSTCVAIAGPLRRKRQAVAGTSGG